MRVAWFSSGCSSFVAAYYGEPDRIVYIDVANQHPDSTVISSRSANRKKLIMIENDPARAERSLFMLIEQASEARQ